MVMVSRHDVQSAIGYIRVSTVEQAEQGYSLEDQSRRIKAYCVAREIDLVGVIADVGISGADPERSGLGGVLAVLEDGYADALVVTKLDRLSRSACLMLTITEELEAAGIAIVSITESIDTSTPAGKFFRTILAGVAEFEKELITERMVAGKRAKQLKLGPAAYLGGPTVPYGFRANGDLMERDPLEWPVLERIQSERSCGATLEAIANGLNNDSIVGKRGGRWHAGTLSRLLRSTEDLLDWCLWI